MRGKILALLSAYPKQYMSGEEIAAKLGVSRTAVWKHIQELKGAGYTIESQSRSGYRITAVPDRMLPELITNGLYTKLIGRNIISFEEIATTNNEAKRRAADGAPEGTIVVSEVQVTGKGRLNRSFFCPRGGIWFSVILRPRFLPQDAPKCTLLAAVAVVRAMRDIGFDAGIKWPNDILYDGKKLTGILTEMSAEMDRINYVVIGIGINANISAESFPDDIKDKATSISAHIGEIDRIGFFQKLLNYFENLYMEVQQHGFGEMLREWRKLSVTLGQEINVIGFEETFAGKAIDIDDDGALLVETADGVRRVLAGDVSIRPHK